ncbi:autotransporter domain-containing protein, partial [Klebsiella aerogenes]|uniref:autotransporter domain-containing protein n=1 Tax=Klebsiella aerogenes TaxID=548 RepID=UPI0013D6EC45
VFNAALYGRHALGAGYVAAALGYSWQDASTDRSISAGGATDMLHGSFQPQALTGRLEGGWRLTTAASGLTPYAALQATALFMP